MTLSSLVEDWKVTVTGASNDAFFVNGGLWGMHGANTSAANQFGSQAASAWAQGYTGSMANVVGVIDTGLDYTHPELYLNIWLNQREIPRLMCWISMAMAALMRVIFLMTPGGKTALMRMAMVFWMI
jgi:subtilisin family serine protease